MSSSGVRKRSLAGIITLLPLVLIIGTAVNVHATAIIWTDQSDYQAGTIVTIYGEGFSPGATATVAVTDRNGATTSWTVPVDPLGGFTTTYQLHYVYGNYTVAANDGANSATTIFHDAGEAANLDQCNNGPVGPPVVPKPCIIGTVSGTSFSDWVNGNSNGQKSHWRESDFIAYRVTATGLSAGAHMLDFEYDTVHGGDHAIDYLGSVNATETFSTSSTMFHANNNNPCTDKLPASQCTPSNPAGFIPVPPANLVNCNGSTGTFASVQILGKVFIWGPVGTTLDSFTYTSQNVPAGSGQCSTSVRLGFHSGAGGSMVVIAWGGHIASGDDWSTGMSASSITGSPYHMALNFLDGTTTGSQDRALSSSAIYYLGSVSTLVKDAAGTTVTYVMVGSQVHDTAILSGASSNAGGTATYSLWNTGSCSGTKLLSQTVQVTNAAVPNSGPFTPLAAGSYSYNITYAGDSNNLLANGDCEPFTVGAAAATLTTSVSPSTITLGPSPVSAQDTATLSNGFNPTGTISFTVFNNPACTGSPVFTSSPVTVNGNGAYSSPPFTPSAIGSYYWVASYSGDANNSPAVGQCGSSGETLVVQLGSPSINTSVSPSTTILTTSAPSATDTATLSGGFNPQGTITFTVFSASSNCGGGPLFTSVVTVNGNGNYVSASFTPPRAGTYYWVASYSGDANNSPSTHPCGANGESLLVLPAGPGIITQVSPSTIVLTTTAGSATDTAMFSGGFNPQATITFNVFSNASCGGASLFTSVVNVNGNGNYVSAPFTPSGVGSYYWVASYSGDSNNNPFAAPCGATGETLSVQSASPTITTQVSPSTIIPTTTIGSAMDTATLSGAFGTPSGTITFNVFFANQTCTGSPLFTSIISVSGNGNYQSAQFFPPGTGTYNWVASYSGDSNNNSFTAPCGANGETLTVQKASPGIITQVSPSIITLTTAGVTATDTATLSAGFGNPKGTIFFGVYGNVGCSGSPLFTSTVSVNGNGNYVSAPFTPPRAGTYYLLASYSGDSNNNPASDACGTTGEILTVQRASPSIVTSVSPSRISLMSSAGSAFDTATLSGGFGIPAGTISFRVYLASSGCVGPALFTSVVSVNGNGNYVSQPFTPPGAGTYYWVASYGGDANNNGFTAPCGANGETLVVDSAGPSNTTTVTPSVIILGANTSSAIDTASLTGGFSPTGILTFTVFADPNCSGSVLFTSTVPVNGNGNYHSAAFTPPGTGTYYWVASYSGDSNNNSFTDACGASGETLTVLPASPTIVTFVSPANVSAAGSATDSATLSGGFHPTVTISFRVFLQNMNCTGSPIFTSVLNVNGNGNYQSAPFTPLGVGTYNWVASYSGDVNNNGFTAPCGATGETLTVVKASPIITTSVSPSTITLTAVAGSAADNALLSGGFNPQGTITFNVYPSNTCGGVAIFTSVVAVNGNGNYASGAFMPPGAGSYYWISSYSGDANNVGFTAPCGARGETLTVNKASPIVTTNVLDSNGKDVTNKMSSQGTPVHDTSVLSGAFPQASGTVTYYFYYNGACSGTPSSSETVIVNSGLVPGSTPQILSLGTYSYQAVYSGDSNNRGSTGECEPFTDGIPVNAVTDTPIPYGSNVAMCNFDTNPTQTLQQFRLLFTQNSSNTYGLTASNPGQFVYNIFQFNGTSVSVTASIPYPFVTQGAVPVHIYDSVNIVTINGRTCYVPGQDVTPLYTITPGPVGITTLSSFSGKFGTYATITVNGPVPATGQAYIWIHLDYGLKKTTGYAKVSDLHTGTRVCDLSKSSPGDDNDANATLRGTGTVSICDNDNYFFSAAGTISLTTASTTIQNNNVFKRDPGVAGLVTDANGTPVGGATVQLFDNNGKLVATVTTDHDGYFGYAFKYTGKQVTYRIVVITSWCVITQDFNIKSKQFVWLNVTVPNEPN